ncbi:MAG TPA: MBL fold metallo-hydrolase [Methylomirabilota bacterium]|nr:MBL fold metallo-hydrolase [Methylomirabilota bacterium]HEV8616991.1 MBL fold metallo-hydrolase [Methylomirabilota bacterium]
MSPSLTFLGAAGTVTGAKFLLETDGARVLMECGMFQGFRGLRERNWQAPPVDPRRLAAVVLSHAHIDHSGYLPRLARDGFTGPIYGSPGTADLLKIMLPDAAHLQEEEAEFRNRKGKTSHRPALPLFTTADAEAALALVRRIPFETRFAPAPGVETILRPSGHILGASIVQMEAGGRRLVYSGDLGRYDVPIMRDPVVVEATDTLLIESTYGNRRHAPDDGTPVLIKAVQRAVEQRGWLLIPSFAIGRAQDILYLLKRLEDDKKIPALPVYLDSPMAIEATAIYARHPEEHDEAMTAASAAGGRPLVPARFQVSRTGEDSKRLNGLEGSLIVIAGSGMATGGRILHHLLHRLPDPRTTVLFVGYQAAGTRGRLLRDGADRLRIFGEDVHVRATVLGTDALSAHADQAELLRWLDGFRKPPGMTYCVHGEPQAAAALRDEIVKRPGWKCEVAADGQKVAV